MYTIPDALSIVYEGTVIYTTNGLVSGFQTFSVPYSGSSMIITVTLSAPNPGTGWELRVNCP